MLRVAGLSFKQGHAEKTDCHPKHFGHRQGFEFQRPQKDKNEDRTQRRDHDNNDRILRSSLTQDDGEAALVDNHVVEWLLAQPGQQLSDHMRSVDTSEMARTNCLGRCRVALRSPELIALAAEFKFYSRISRRRVSDSMRSMRGT
jgi:hypothetical protein